MLPAALASWLPLYPPAFLTFTEPCSISLRHRHSNKFILSVIGSCCDSLHLPACCWEAVRAVCAAVSTHVCNCGEHSSFPLPLPFLPEPFPAAFPLHHGKHPQSAAPRMRGCITPQIHVSARRTDRGGAGCAAAGSIRSQQRRSLAVALLLCHGVGILGHHVLW